MTVETEVGPAMQNTAVPPVDLLDVSYDDDVLRAERRAKSLRAGRLQDLDFPHPAGEMEGVRHSYRDEIESRLLKWKYQPGHRPGSREGTRLEQRRRIARVVRRAPSLRTYPEEGFDECYLSGRLAAARETGMDFTLFPIDPPFTVFEALDQDSLTVVPDRGARS